MIYGRLQRPWASIIILCLNLCCFVVFCRRIARHTIKFRSSFILFYFTYLSTMQCCENNIFLTKPNGIGGKHTSSCQMHFCYLGYFHVYSHLYWVSIAQPNIKIQQKPSRILYSENTVHQWKKNNEYSTTTSRQLCSFSLRHRNGRSFAVRPASDHETGSECPETSS